MTGHSASNTVTMIPVNAIRILNPRERNARKFREMVLSIEKVGLKRPITVSRTTGSSPEYEYDLVCGQGRLEAFRQLKQATIPAIVIEATTEECYVMSLVENLARRQHSSLELMHEIGVLERRGYDPSQIAAKTGLTREYVKQILHLIHNGEERLLASVDRNLIPVSVAVEIATTKDEDIQQALTEAYERKELRGQKLQIARRLVEQRRRRGKTLEGSGRQRSSRPLTSQAMVRAYKQETERQRAMITKSDMTERRLLFIVAALKELFQDENFVTLLRAEGLETVPRQLADLIHGSRNVS
ncbi:plasmid partitioning protein RepB C-terminal domain-containing protein [Kordiimonas aestuarii]|uniref:plasmid partitioning protein RepB C-terminal domain-containing protein n=1 Tax=Kordiimonas aestuarii TaxID=1005925 RepID=UPI0021D3BC0D|nr:plasmid partitioning protein RepB C-terminal domain-containing protein [Kordiimonas aestuarii]